ncbi:hypothetical protein ACTJIJ_17240 [Niabella sp. 22666]|uniref:hypothetical protein n=1 Tax=Niabella sp. 22666 TaxID=3453954 RepID=UPI003F863108
MKFIAEILNILDSLGPALAVGVLLSGKRALPKELQLIFIFCLVQLLCNTTATIIERLAMPNSFFFLQNNYWVYKLNSTACFLIVLYLFARHLLHFKLPLLYTFLLLYALISVLLIISGDGISQFNSVSSALESIVIVALCLYFFYSKLINTHEEVSIPETSIFWCVVGIFTYYAGAFFIFISYKYLIGSNDSTVGVLWRFHNILLFICSLYVSYGILCKNYRTILS